MFPKEKDKPKKQRKKTTSQLKKELDKIFSLYVRKKAADQEGYINCYTCGVRKLLGELQCGHFVSRSHLSTRYDENNVRPQCVGCNMFGKGRTTEFANNLERDCGVGTVAGLYKKAQEVVSDFPYEQKIEEYKQKLNDLG